MSKLKRLAIVNVNLQFEIPNNVKDEDIKDYLFEVELPKEYVEDSFEYVKTVREDDKGKVISEFV